MKPAVYVMPFVAFAVLGYIVFYSYFSTPPANEPSALIGRPVPALELSPLDENTPSFGPSDFTGHITVLNVFASWCAPCREESPMLSMLSKVKGVALYGLVYKDSPQKARAFLGGIGNPFSRIALDQKGDAANTWDISGVPETFVIDEKGIVRLRITGPLTAAALADRLLPAIRQAKLAQ